MISAGTAAAQCSSLPYTFTNGTTADASQVNANFSYLLNCANNQAAPAILRGWIAGLTMSNDTTNPNTVIDTSAGVANSDDATTMMTLAAFTKSTSGWTVGTGNGCIDTGTVQPNTWYHLFVIVRTDTSVVDQLCSTSATSPSMPTNYTKKRRIGSFKTASGSTNIVPFIQDGDYFQWKTVPMEPGINNPGTAAVLRSLSVPIGVSVVSQAFYSVQNNSTTYAVEFYVNDPATTSITPTPQLSQITYTAWSAERAADNNVELLVRTDTQGRVQTRIGSTNGATDTNTSLNFGTRGWFDTRGRFN